MTIYLYQNDLPAELNLGPVVAIDTETMGLDPRRDRLCLVQLSSGDGHAHLVQIARGQTTAPNLMRLLSDPATLIRSVRSVKLADLASALPDGVPMATLASRAEQIARRIAEHGLRLAE